MSYLKFKRQLLESKQEGNDKVYVVFYRHYLLGGTYYSSEFRSANEAMIDLEYKEKDTSGILPEGGVNACVALVDRNELDDFYNSNGDEAYIITKDELWNLVTLEDFSDFDD